MATIGKLVIQIGADTSALDSGLSSVQSNLRNFGGQLKNVGKSMTLGITAPLVGIGVVALNSAAGFEESMNLMQTMSGATGAEMEAMTAQALELGAVTTFSAGDAATAMLELSKAGMSVAEVTAAVPGVLDLAAAGGIGLADAATITANAINAFGLEASASAGVANTFAAAANASSADVMTLADGFKNAGAVFSSNGQSVSDLATALSILSNNGIDGAEAGTQLKVMMQRLTSPTDEARRTLTELGVSVYDANGKIDDFETIVGQLAGGLDGLSDSQRNMALSTIFGTHAVNAATILAANGADGFSEMQKAVDKAGAAAELGETRMKGIGGAIEYFKGTIDSLLIGTALPWLDMLGSMIKRAADLIAGFGTLSPAVQRFAVVLGVVLAAAGPILIAMGTLATIIAALISPVGLAIAVVAALGVAFATNFLGIRTAVMRAWTYIAPYLNQAVAWLREKIPAALSTLQGWFQSAWSTASTAVSEAWAVIQPWLAAAETWFKTTLVAALDTLQGWFDTAWNAAQSAVETAWGAIEPWLTAAKDWFLTNLPGALDTLRGWFETAWTAASAAVSTAWGVIVGYVQQAWGWFLVNLPVALATLQGWFQTAWTAAQEAVATAWGVLQPILTQVWGWLVANLPGALATLQSWFETAWTAASGAVTTAWAAIGPILTQVWGWLVANIPGALATLQSWFETAWNAASSAVTTAWGIIKPLVLGAVEWFRALLPGSLTELQARFSGAWTAITAALSSAWTTMQGTLNTMREFFTGTLPDSFTTLQTTVTTILTAIQDAWNVLADFFGPSIENLKTAFTDLGTSIGDMGPSVTGLVTAFQNFYNAVLPILTFFGVILAIVFGGAATILIAVFTALIQGLAPMLQGVIDTMTGILNGFALIFAGVVELFRMMIEGDWVGVWAAAGTIVQGAVDVIAAIFGGLRTIVEAIFKLLWNTLVNILSAMGVEMSSIIEGIKSWWAEKWQSMTAFVQPVIDIVGEVQAKIQEFASWLSSLHFSNPFAGLGGGTEVPSAGTSVGPNGFVSGAHASGTLRAPGGIALVGERGPELVAMPVGARVWSNADTRQMLGGGESVINMGPIYMNDKVDVEQVAYRVATIITKRRR